MNPWDLVTWIACVILAGSAVLIFGFFLKDARDLFDPGRRNLEEAPPAGDATEEDFR